MVTRDVWFSLSDKDKLSKVVECLNQINDIETGKHQLSGTPTQGRLCHVKKDLEKFLVNTALWEAE